MTETVTRFPPCPECGVARWKRCEEGVWTSVQRVIWKKDWNMTDGATEGPALSDPETYPTPGTENFFRAWWQCENGHKQDDGRIVEVLEEAL